MCRKDVGDFYTLNIFEAESLPTPPPPSAPPIRQHNYRTMEIRPRPPQQQHQQARIKLARIVCFIISSIITISIVIVMIKILQHSNT
jgi:hypothetical protein